MNREEARTDLMVAQADIYYRPKDDSIDMAIKALENQKTIIEEFESLKAKVCKPNEMEYFENSNVWQKWFCDLIDKRIAELKGENNA